MAINRNNKKATPIPVVPATMKIVNADGTVTRSGQLLLEQLQDLAGAGAFEVVAWDIDDSHVGTDVSKHIGVLQAGQTVDISAVFTMVSAADFTAQVKLGTQVLGKVTIPGGTSNTKVTTAPTLDTFDVPEGSVPTLDILASDGLGTATVWLRMLPS